MQRFPSRALLLLVPFILTLSARVNAQTAIDKAIAAEFPSHDSQLLRVQQRGNGIAAATAALARDPDAVDTLALLLAQEQIDDAIVVAERIVAAHPDRLLPALKLVARESYRFRDKPRGQPEALARIARNARQRLAELPREEAARAARQIIMFEPRQPGAPRANAYEESLNEFIRDYAGTEEAVLTEVDRLTRGRVSWAQIDSLVAFARARPGTTPGAKALFDAGSQLGVNIPVTGVEPRGSDPTDRFMRVLGIVKELESGAYPRSEWVDRAPELVTGFFASNPAIAPANVEQLAAEYVAFARTHFDPKDPDLGGSRVAYLLTNKLADLYKSQGDPTPHVEGALDRLAEETAQAAFVYMKASYYLYSSINVPGQRAAMRTKAMEVLRKLSEAGTDLSHRKALATLAYLEFEDRNYRGALEHFTQYVRKYPSSPYAWIAALRIGASQAGLDDWKAATAAYRTASARYDTIPLARMLGHEYAARSLEALDDFTGALGERDAALRGWDPAYAPYSGRDLTLASWPNPSEIPPVAVEPAPAMTAEALGERAAQLRTSLAHPSGPLLERGRRLLQQDRRGEAVDTLARLLKQYPRSPFANEARSLSHHAQLEIALIAANVEAAAPQPSAALTQLTTLIGEPYDDAVCVAGIARATLLTRDRVEEARGVMQDTLARCRTRGARIGRATAAGLEADAIAVRNAVFRPLGGGVYDGKGWNAFSWPLAPPPFLLVAGTIRVKTADGKEIDAVLRDPFPGIDNVVFVSSEQIHLLTVVMTALGGNKRFVPASVMATPNQPAGAALDVLAFWNQFFPARGGHWGGWEFEAYPRIGAIEFLDAARTRAAVPVTIGYSGATVVLEKRNGVWQTVELTNQWIT